MGLVGSEMCIRDSVNVGWMNCVKLSQICELVLWKLQVFGRSEFYNLNFLWSFFYFHISNLQNAWSFRKTNLQILKSFTQFIHPKFITTTAFGCVKLFYENNTFLEASHNSLVLTQDPQGTFNFHWSFQLFHTSDLQNTWSFQLFIIPTFQIPWAFAKLISKF
mgnify:CR=1 FL=1